MPNNPKSKQLLSSLGALKCQDCCGGINPQYFSRLTFSVAKKKGVTNNINVICPNICILAKPFDKITNLKGGGCQISVSNAHACVNKLQRIPTNIMRRLYCTDEWFQPPEKNLEELLYFYGNISTFLSLAIKYQLPRDLLLANHSMYRLIQADTSACSRHAFSLQLLKDEHQL